MSVNNSLTSAYDANIKRWSHPLVIYICHLDFAHIPHLYAHH